MRKKREKGNEENEIQLMQSPKKITPTPLANTTFFSRVWIFFIFLGPATVFLFTL